LKNNIFVIIGVFILLNGFAFGADAPMDETCVSCHNKETARVVKVWSGSAHSSADIGCEECHGTDNGPKHYEDGARKTVEAFICARCHEDQAKAHFAGKHGISFRAGRACTRNMEKTRKVLEGCNDCHEKGSTLLRQEAECARFLAQSPSMQRQGCLSCHKIENRCDACHTPHDTDLEIVNDPAVCGTCHMGPDHPQYEMWKSSRHGVMYSQKGREYAPGCTACHMPSGSHDVSAGISMGLFGQKYPDEIRAVQRQRMLDICTQCHSRSLAEQNLSDGDAIQKEAKALIDEAASIIKGLDAEGLLKPGPAERPAHPLSGRQLDIGPQMLYEDLSAVEALFFRMKKFYYIITYKGVFHQNPDYAHWYGNAPMKLALAEIKSNAILLREIYRIKKQVNNLSAMEHDRHGDGTPIGLEEELKLKLRKLKDRFLREEISKDEYEEMRIKLLDEHGL
jgi:hypothetical protein